MSLKEKTNNIKVSGTNYLLIPNLLIKDSAFPFDMMNDTLIMTIVNNKLVIEKKIWKKK